MQARTTISAICLAGLFFVGGIAASLATLTNAQPPPQAPASVIDIATHGEFDGTGSTIFRLWSDGLVEQNRTACVGCGWAGWVVVPEN